MRKALLGILLFISFTHTFAARVFVSVLPLKYFVNRIGGDKVDVKVMVKAGQSPETYAPTPKQMALLEQTVIYYRIGVPFENVWLKKIRQINPNMKIIDLRKGIYLKKLVDGTDPHIWNSPKLVMHMAKTIRNSLIAIDSKNNQFYQSNYLAFRNDLVRLDTYIHAQLKHLQNRVFFVFHPAWGYFADAYGLKQIAIEKEGKQPGPRDIARIIDIAKRNRIRVIFVQPQFNKTQAQIIARSIQARIITVDALAEDYLHNMRRMANILGHACRGRFPCPPMCNE